MSSISFWERGLGLDDGKSPTARCLLEGHEAGRQLMRHYIHDIIYIYTHAK